MENLDIEKLFRYFRDIIMTSRHFLSGIYRVTLACFYFELQFPNIVFEANLIKNFR